MAKKILIVDDEPDLIDIFSFCFTQDGWQVETAENGKLALQKIETFLPDVVLSDITMPEMDGLKFLETLFNKGSEVPVIFLSGFSDVDKMKKAWGYCAFEFLDKPFDEKLMLRVANSAFETGRDYVRTARKRYNKFNKIS